MIAIFGCAALVAALLCARPARRRLRQALRVERAAGAVRAAPRWHRYAPVAGAVLLVCAVAWMFHARWGVIAVCVSLSGATLVRTLVGRRRAAIALRAREETAAGCAALAAEMAAGRVPAAALASAAEYFPVLAGGAAAALMSADPTLTWRSEAALPGRRGLRTLAAAWQVSAHTGAPMAELLAAVAEELRADKALALTVTSELAAPRATGRLLAFLPVFGILLGFGIGGDPLKFLLDQPYGQACLVAGVALACAGLIWTEHMADEATTW